MKSNAKLVKLQKANIELLGKQYDEIVKQLRDTPMIKADYDAIEQELRDMVYSCKDEVDTL